MKIILKFILILIVIASVATGMIVKCQAETAAVSASGTKALTPGALLDDFRYGASLNIWGALTGTFSSSGVVPPPADAKCTASYASDAFGGAGYSLKLDYNVGAANSFAGYYSLLGSASLTGYTSVSFYVKGAVGGEFFKIELKNTSATSYWDAGNATHYFRNTASIYIADYLDGGVTTTWQKVTIPFHNFANLDGWGSMKEFVIVFENSQSTTNGSVTSGTIYIDNITFETSAIPVVRIDHFGDKLGVNALGGNIGTGVGGGASALLNKYSFSNTANEYDPAGSPYGMRLDYDVTSGYAYTFLIFGGGNTDNTVEKPEKGGWIAIPHDFSAYTKITFKAKAETDAKNPKTMKMELADNGGEGKYVLVDAIPFGGPLTTTWKTYTIPLSAVPLLDKTSIKKLTFVLEGWRIGAAGGNKAGTVFIDSMQFE